jgi:lipopolysaccharide biosynthesis regulator YciM
MAMLVEPDVRVKQPPLYRQCRNPKGYPKIKYRARAHAVARMRSMVARGMRGLNVYRCDQCGFYHVGHRGAS